MELPITVTVSERELPITITVRHRLDRDALLELRDEIVDALEPLGIALEMTSDGTEVVMRHAATVPHLMDALADVMVRDAVGAARVDAAERAMNVKYGDPADPEWKGDGCRG